jgi:signal transduction histidine kinase
MSLKIRLALIYSLSVFIILVASAISIYLLNESFRKEEFHKRLVLESSESFQLVANERGISPAVAEELNAKAANALQSEEIFIYNASLRIIYASPHSQQPKIPSRFFSEAKSKQHYYFTEGRRETVILFRRIDEKQFYVVVSAVDIFGRRKSDNLKLLLIFSILGGILFSGLLAFFYVRQTMKPLEKLKSQIGMITEQNLKQRIAIPKNNNEVWQIAEKFNAMLDRLEQAFEQRKNFVQHASHELRTPLANMLSQTESALNKTLSEDEYRKVLNSLKEDQQNLIDLTNSLLALSRYETISNVKDWTLIRIDEILYQTAEFINQIWPEAVVSIDFISVPEDENHLVYKGNESLLRSAIQNLTKNAIQYSDNRRVRICIDANESGVTLKFENEGKQLTAEEQNRLFIPFFRGENSLYKKGYGLGLAIVQRIINVHNATISYETEGDKTNRFILFFPAK